MNESSRIFDYIDFQLNKFPKADMFSGKENGVWKNYSSAEVKDSIIKNKFQFINIGGRINGTNGCSNLLAGHIKHQPFGPVFRYECNLILVFNGHVVSANTQFYQPGT